MKNGDIGKSGFFRRRKDDDDWKGAMRGVARAFCFVVGGVVVVIVLWQLLARAHRNEQLAQKTQPAIDATALAMRELDALKRKPEWPEVAPLAQREKWDASIAGTKSRLDLAVATGPCRKGSKDFDGCEALMDTVAEEMHGMIDHLRLVKQDLAAREEVIASTRKKIAEGDGLYRQAIHLVPAAGEDGKLVTKLGLDLAAAKKKDLTNFAELFEASLVAANSTERLSWLVNRVKDDAAARAEAWVVKVVRSTPTYRATLDRTTWNNNIDSPALSHIVREVEIPRDIYDVLRTDVGKKMVDVTPSYISYHMMTSELHLKDLAGEPFPPGDNDGEIDLDDCYDAVAVKLEISFNGRKVTKDAVVPREDFRTVPPPAVGQVFIVKGRNEAPEKVSVPVWFSPTWSNVYNGL